MYQFFCATSTLRIPVEFSVLASFILTLISLITAGEMRTVHDWNEQAIRHCIQYLYHVRSVDTCWENRGRMAEAQKSRLLFFSFLLHFYSQVKGAVLD